MFIRRGHANGNGRIQLNASAATKADTFVVSDRRVVLSVGGGEGVLDYFLIGDGFFLVFFVFGRFCFLGVVPVGMVGAVLFS